MNHIAQYRNGLHHQIHHNPCPPIHNFTARFPSPTLGPLPDSVMIPQIVSDGTLHYHNAPLQSFISGTDSRQQQSDNSDKVSSNHRKQIMIRNFQPASTPIISAQSQSCSTRQEPPSKGTDSNCNDHSYKPTQNTTVENHQFIQHCESFISGADNRHQQQNDNTDKMSSNHRKQTMINNFQSGSAHIIPTQTPNCTSRQESPPKGSDSNCNDHGYKSAQNSSVENHQFIQHCESYISGTDSRQQQQNDNTDKISSDHRKQTLIRNFQSGSASILSNQSPSCSTRQEQPAKASDSSNCNDHSYKHTQSSSVENHHFIQHCDQGAKNCVQCYNLLKTETPGAIIKVMVDAATMTDQEELDQTGNWSLVSNSLPPSNTKVTEYLSNLRQFLKVDHKPHERKRQRQGDVRIVTSPDGSRLYFCPECHAAYPDKNLLEPHLAAHKIERRFICNVCGAGLKRKEHLDRHQLSHSEERPYSCTVCSKTFKRNEHLSRHSIIHSGLKPQVCNECGKSFYRSDHLRKHLLGHSFQRFKQRQKQLGVNNPPDVPTSSLIPISSLNIPSSTPSSSLNTSNNPKFPTISINSTTTSADTQADTSNLIQPTHAVFLETPKYL